MDMQTSPSVAERDAGFSVRDLRRELGLTQEAFGAMIGLKNKASVSLLESGQRGGCSLPVAIRLEELSAGRIDAAALNEDVRLARHSSANTPRGAQDHGA